MNNERYVAELHPEWKAVEIIPPPNGTKILLRTRYGTAIIGQYYPEGEFTHWCGLPKLSKAEKERINGKTETKHSGQRDWVLEHS